MTNSGSKKLIILLATALLVGFVAIVIKNYNSKTSLKKINQEVIENQKQDEVNSSMENTEFKIDESALKIQDSDFVFGDKNAKITIIEYASLSCPHCAAFYREAFDKLKEEYIDNGKVKFIYRDFPLNQPALVAAMVAMCRAQDESGDKNSAYYNLVKALFKTQDSWAFDQKYSEKIEAIAALDGMSKGRFDNCLNDKKLQTKLLEARMSAAKSLNINSTPTFYINGEVVEGYVDYKSIKKVIDSKL